MREIRFRFWTPDKRMIDDHEGWVEGIGINEAIQASIGYGYVPMQYTGLKDKNGKEAYHSDIVKVFHYRDPEQYSLAVIGWDEKYACVDLQYIVKETPAYRIGVHPMEIIGNIYEHPHLLTTQQG